MSETLHRIVLIDDHGLCRRGLCDLLERTHSEIKVVASTGDPEEALSALFEHAPDLAVMDLRMPLMDGLSLLTRFRAEGVTTPVVILTMSDAQEDIARALRAGVRGYLLKDMKPDEVVQAIRRCARGELVVAPALAAKLANLFQAGDPAPVEAPREKTQKLTEREREILMCVASGKSNKAIAKSLNISHDTVKLHVRHIFAKLKLSSRVEAAVFAVEHGVAMKQGAQPG